MPFRREIPSTPVPLLPGSSQLPPSAGGELGIKHRCLCRQTAPKKARMAVARKLLIAVWHILSNGEADRFATDAQVVCSFFALAYKLQVRNLPDGMSALQFTRHHLDRLGIG